jgi:hypothetical protein
MEDSRTLAQSDSSIRTWDPSIVDLDCPFDLRDLTSAWLFIP